MPTCYANVVHGNLRVALGEANGPASAAQLTNCTTSTSTSTSTSTDFSLTQHNDTKPYTYTWLSCASIHFRSESSVKSIPLPRRYLLYVTRITATASSPQFYIPQRHLTILDFVPSHSTSSSLCASWEVRALAYSGIAIYRFRGGPQPESSFIPYPG